MATTHVLIRFEGPLSHVAHFTRFVVNGEEVEVTRFIESDLEWEKTVPISFARELWKELVKAGWKRETPMLRSESETHSLPE